MFSGLNKYSLNGHSVAAREIASYASTHGTIALGREVARGGRSSGRIETASAGGGGNITSSAMVLGGISYEDISLNYIGGSSDARANGGGSQSKVPMEIYRYYDAIFREDSVCGAAIELRSSIPYGDFTIHGVPKARLQKYEEAIDNMRLRTMMPRIAIERDVQGAYLGLLDWNSENRTYDSMLPYSRQHIANMFYPIVHGMDPVIDINLNVFLNDIVNSNDPRLKAIKANIPKFIHSAKNNKGRGIPVPMDSVVWIDRPHTDPRFNSMLHRILPVFLIERALMRGTIESAHRRQRGILHITAGSGDLWLATPEEMSTVAQLFNNADADPLGAIVVTREGISTNEVRNPTDFWRSTDSLEQTIPFKLRTLGISESFLSGDATFNNAEVAISTFLQTVKTERNQVTDQLMYRKIFPQIAQANDYKASGIGRERGTENFSKEERERSMAVAFEVAKLVSEGKKDKAAAISYRYREELAANAANSLQNISDYDIPKVTWKQSLMPEGDSAYIEMLNMLAEKDIPAPIRAMFAAGGMDFDTIMANSKQDIEDRKKLTKYIEDIRASRPSPDPALQEGGEFAMEYASPASNLLNRDWQSDRQSEYMEPYTEVGGKRTRPITSTGKKMLRDKQHKELAHALSRIAEVHNAKVRAGIE